jgi:hypothetical protein
MSSIKNFFYPRADFFGPKADELRDLLDEVPVEHMIAGCNAEQTRAINTLARARIHCETWPEWQRYDGSIIYDKLPEKVKKFFKHEYLDKDGYVDVSGLHISGKDFVLGWAEGQRMEGHIKCPFDNQSIRQFVACPALSIRLAEGLEFDPSEHRKVLLHRTPTLNMDRKGQTVPLHRRLKEIVEGTIQDEEMDRFKSVWDYALAHSKSPSQSNTLPTIVTLIVGVGLVALLKVKSKNISKYYQKVIDVASRHFPSLLGSGIIAVSTHSGGISRPTQS